MKDTVLGFAKRKRRGKERNLTYIVVCEKEREKNCPPFWLRSKIFKRRKDDLCVKTVLSTYWRDENSSLISSVRETFLPFFSLSFFLPFFSIFIIADIAKDDVHHLVWSAKDEMVACPFASWQQQKQRCSVWWPQTKVMIWPWLRRHHSSSLCGKTWQGRNHLRCHRKISIGEVKSCVHLHYLFACPKLVLK